MAGESTALRAHAAPAVAAPRLAARLLIAAVVALLAVLYMQYGARALHLGHDPYAVI